MTSGFSVRNSWGGVVIRKVLAIIFAVGLASPALSAESRTSQRIAREATQLARAANNLSNLADDHNRNALARNADDLQREARQLGNVAQRNRNDQRIRQEWQ